MKQKTHRPTEQDREIMSSGNNRRSGERCTCLPLGSVSTETSKRIAPTTSEQQLVLSAELQERLNNQLDELLPAHPMLSLITIHLFQREPAPLSSSLAALTRSRQRRFHAPTHVLDEILAYVRRAIRFSDRMLIHANSGAAIIFPHVHHDNAFHILKRVTDNLDLLQAETMTPPLTRETTIQVGLGTYIQSQQTRQQLLSQAGQLCYSINLRPSITGQLYGVKPAPAFHVSSTSTSKLYGSIVPYIKLPRTLPTHLKTLLPYTLACEIRCVPMGYHQQRLTVAMAEPTNHHLIERLQAITGLTIFPVSCDECDLNTLLTQQW